MSGSAVIHSDIVDIVDERTPLMQRNLKSNMAPLPTQVKIVLLQQLTERIALVSIHPYINQLISQLDITGGDKKKVGYYTGIIDSSVFLAKALTVLQWSRASDYVGRRPMLIIGLLGQSFSMLTFGLSRTFWSLVLSRCMYGVFNGNIGVVKSVIGETTDETNRARGFSLIAVVWAAGSTVGPLIGGSLVRPHERFPAPLIGGSLVRPHERFPALFTHPFWVKYAYFIPSAAAACFMIFAMIITIMYFKETNSRITDKRSISSSQATHRSESENPLSLKDVLTYRAVISVSNYMALVFLNIAVNALTPLFLSMPIEIGGLGLSPLTIGYIIGVSGAVTGLYQAFFFSAIIRRFGERRIFVLGIMVFIPIFLLFPAISIIAKRYGINAVVSVLVTLLLSLLAFMDMAYGCIYIYITASARNKRSLGATNGLSQTGSSIAMAMGPVTATSLFSYSVEKNIFYGYGVYAIFAFLSVAAIFLAIQLPIKIWDSHEDDHEREQLVDNVS